MFTTLLHQALEDPPDVTDHDKLISLVLDPSSVEHLPADAVLPGALFQKAMLCPAL